MEKEITIGEKKFKIRELLNKEVRNFPVILDTDSVEEKKNKAEEEAKQQIMLSASLTEEQYEKLTYKEYLTLRKAILELNTPEKDFWATN